MKLAKNILLGVVLIAGMVTLFAFIIIMDNQPVDLYTRTGPVPSPTVSYRLPYAIQSPHNESAGDHVFTSSPLVDRP